MSRLLRTHTDRQTVAGLRASVLSTQGWVPPLFREKDVISLVKNPTYVACHSWLNPGFSFVQSLPFPASPLTFSYLLSPSLPISPRLCGWVILQCTGLLLGRFITLCPHRCRKPTHAALRVIYQTKNCAAEIIWADIMIAIYDLFFIGLYSSR